MNINLSFCLKIVTSVLFFAPFSFSQGKELSAASSSRMCMNGECVMTTGDGKDECKEDSDCGHNECDDYSGTCERVPEPGLDRCGSNNDCSHRECFYDGTCELAMGAGPDRCEDDLDCPVHKACDSVLGCVLTSGAGPDRCRSSGECIAHRSPRRCVGAACKRVRGFGLDECSNDEYCEGGLAGISPSTTTPIVIAQSPAVTLSNLKILNAAKPAQLVFGNRSNMNTIVMFQDLTCGMCARAYEIYLPKIRELVNAGQAKFEIRDMALSPSSSLANAAAELRCANRYGKYIEVAKGAYKLRGLITENYLESVIREFKFPKQEYLKCVKDRAYLAEVTGDYELAKALELESTPVFFVNGVKLTGTAWKWASLKDLLTTGDKIEAEQSKSNW